MSARRQAVALAALLAALAAVARADVLYTLGRPWEPATFGYAVSTAGNTSAPSAVWARHKLVDVVDLVPVENGNYTLYRDRALNALFRTAAWPSGNASAAIERVGPVPAVPPLGPSSSAAADRGLAMHEASGRVFVASGDRILVAAGVKEAGAGAWRPFASLAPGAPHSSGPIDPRVKLAVDEQGMQLYATFLGNCTGGPLCSSADTGHGSVLTSVLRFNLSDTSGDAEAQTFLQAARPRAGGGQYDCAVCVAVAQGTVAICSCAGPQVANTTQHSLPARARPVVFGDGWQPSAYATVTDAVVLDEFSLAFSVPCSLEDQCTSWVVSGPANSSSAFASSKFPDAFVAHALAAFPGTAPHGSRFLGGGQLVTKYTYDDFPPWKFAQPDAGALADQYSYSLLAVDHLANRPRAVAVAGGRFWGVDNATGLIVTAPFPRPGSPGAATLQHPLVDNGLCWPIASRAGPTRGMTHDAKAGLVFMMLLSDEETPRDATTYSHWHMVMVPQPESGVNGTCGSRLNGTGSNGVARAVTDRAGRHVYYLNGRGEVMRFEMATGESLVCARHFAGDEYDAPRWLHDFFLDEANASLMLLANGDYDCGDSCVRTVVLRVPADCSAPAPAYAYAGANQSFYDSGGGFNGLAPHGSPSALAPAGTPQAANGSYYAAIVSDNDRSQSAGVALFQSSPPKVRARVTIVNTDVRGLEATPRGVYLSTDDGLLLACNTTAAGCRAVPVTDAVLPRRFVETPKWTFYYDAAYCALMARATGAPVVAQAARVVSRLATPQKAVDVWCTSKVNGMAVDAAAGLLYVTVGSYVEGWGGAWPAPGLYAVPLDGPPAPLRAVAVGGAGNATAALAYALDVGGFALVPPAKDGAAATRALVGIIAEVTPYQVETRVVEVDLQAGAAVSWQALPNMSDGYVQVTEVVLPAEEPRAPLLILDLFDDYAGIAVFACDGDGGRVCGNLTRVSPSGGCLTGLTALRNGSFVAVDTCVHATFSGPSLVGGRRGDTFPLLPANDTQPPHPPALALLYPNAPDAQITMPVYAAAMASGSLLVADDDGVSRFALPDGLLAAWEVGAPPPREPPSLAWTRAPRLPAFHVRALAAAPGDALAFSVGSLVTRAWTPAWLGVLREDDAQAAAAAWATNGTSGGFSWAPFVPRPLADAAGSPLRVDTLSVFGSGANASDPLQLGVVAMDTPRGSLSVAAPGNTTARVLVHRPAMEPSAEPSAAALDGARGEYFWSDQGTGAVMRAAFRDAAPDGAHAVLVTAPEHSMWNATALAVDPERHELYFTSRNHSAVLMVPLPAGTDAQPSPSDVRVVLRAGEAPGVPSAGTFVSLAFDAGTLFAVPGDRNAQRAGGSAVVLWNRASGKAKALDAGAPVYGVTPSQGLFA